MLAALLPGELVLSVKQHQKFKQMGMDKVLNFFEGGTVPGATAPTLRSMSSGGGDVFNLPITVKGGGQGLDLNQLRKVMQQTAQQEIMRQKRPRGMLECFWDN